MKKTISVVVDFQACKACLYCLESCPVNVFDYGLERNDKGYGPPVVARVVDCIGCQNCFYACPDFCLSVEVQDSP
jgi:2-oxoglutarate ferredoxin oxidoreductase subunit delta